MVDISEMLSPMATDVLRSMIQHGTKSSANSKEIEALRGIVREQLLRELRYNAELLNEQQLDAAVRVLNLETKALDFVCDQAIPLQTLLDRSISESVLQKAAGGNKKHSMHLSKLNSEAELIERLIHRIKVVQIRARYDVTLGDISYLRKLLIAAQIALSQE